MISKANFFYSPNITNSKQVTNGNAPSGSGGGGELFEKFQKQKQTAVVPFVDIKRPNNAMQSQSNPPLNNFSRPILETNNSASSLPSTTEDTVSTVVIIYTYIFF